MARRAARRVHRRTGRLIHIDADDTVVRGRPQGLERAVGNLLENAAKFDPNDQEPLSVHIRRGRTTVRDRGPGIDAADAARVFDRFYRAATARSLPGSGLGLAIVREVAETHVGTVFAERVLGAGRPSDSPCTTHDSCGTAARGRSPLPYFPTDLGGADATIPWFSACF
ncbi:sensor histidine kinase [Streptomyces canus]|uniref:sensor histidine kinase n=1 Tax=Streptomyces canus TaxID=58343 RepID=UPI0036753292